LRENKNGQKRYFSKSEFIAYDDSDQPTAWREVFLFRSGDVGGEV